MVEDLFTTIVSAGSSAQLVDDLANDEWYQLSWSLTKAQAESGKIKPAGCW